MATNPEALEVFHDIVKHTRATLEENQHIPPVIMLFNTHTNVMTEVGFDSSSPLTKDVSTMMAKMAAKAIEADLAITVMEVWYVEVEGAEAAAEATQVAPSESPHRKEAVTFTIEVKGVGTRLVRQPLIREGDHVTFGEVDLSTAYGSGKTSHLSGRMTGILED